MALTNKSNTFEFSEVAGLRFTPRYVSNINKLFVTSSQIVWNLFSIMNGITPAWKDGTKVIKVMRAKCSFSRCISSSVSPAFLIVLHTTVLPSSSRKGDLIHNGRYKVNFNEIIMITCAISRRFKLAPSLRFLDSILLQYFRTVINKYTEKKFNIFRSYEQVVYEDATLKSDELDVRFSKIFSVIFF